MDQKEFHEIISDEEIVNTARKYEYEDKRERCLILRIIFWAIVLIGSIDEKHTLYSLIIRMLPDLFKKYGREAKTVTPAALSKKYAVMDWRIFRDIYNNTLSKYSDIIETDLGEVLNKFKDIHIVDSTSINLSILLQDVFEATNKNMSALKIHTKFSLKKFVPIGIEIGSQKEHDSNYNFVSEESGILYLADLGYWCFDVFETIMEKKSFFVSRLKKGCVVKIEKVLSGNELFEGKTLSEMIPFIKSEPIDLEVKLKGISKPLRVVGLKHEGEWYFYLTSIFDKKLTPEIIYNIYRLRWVIELVFNDLKNVINLSNIAAKNPNIVKIEIYAKLIFFLLTRIIMALAAKKHAAEQEEFCAEKINTNENRDKSATEKIEKGGDVKESKNKDAAKRSKKVKEGYSMRTCLKHVKAHAYNLFESIILHDNKKLEETLSIIILLINTNGFITRRGRKKALSGIT